MPKDLLHLGRIPTLDELRAFFKENDFSTSVIMDMDYSKMEPDAVASLEYIKKFMHDEWEPLSREMGLKSDSAYYSKDNPLIALRDNTENLVTSGVFKLLEEQPDTVAQILEQFMDENGNFVGNVDEFLHNAVETVMKVMSYEETAKIIQEIPIYEDYNHDKKLNYRAADFDKKWHHTRAKTKTVALQDMIDDNGNEIEIIDNSTNVSDEALANIKQETFWSAITEEDKKLLRMRMTGLMQEEIAKALGYKTYSAVAKRLQKLKEIFENCA